MPPPELADLSIVDAIPAHIWRAAPDGAIQFVNQQWMDYTGLSQAESQGSPWASTNVIHPDDLPGLLDTWRRVLAAGQPDQAEARVRRFDGEYRWYLIRAVPVRDRSGAIVNASSSAYFVHRFAKRAGKNITDVARDSLSLLRAYPWPGNIRELQNVIERAVIVSDTETLTVDERWLAKRPAAHHAAPAPLGDELLAHERARVEAALSESHGRVSGPDGAAARLGIPRSTLESRIRSLKLDKHRFRKGPHS